MKNWSKFLSIVLAAAAFAGCADKEDLGSKSHEGLEGNPSVFMHVNVTLPSGGAAVRTATGDTGEEVGKDFENKVNSILLVLADTEDTYIAHSLVGGLSTESVSGKPQVSATASISKTVLANYYPDGGALKDNKVNVYVYCNPTQELIEMFNGDSRENWIDAACKVLEGGSVSQNVSIWAENTFLMSNARKEVRAIPATLGAWDDFSKETNPFKLCGENGGGADNTDAGAIKVERSVARFDFKDGSEKIDGKANTYNIGATGGMPDGTMTVELTRMALVNMSNEFYYLRRVSADGLNENSDMCGKELANNYVVDTDADYKKGSAVDAATLSEHFNYCLFDKEGKINSDTREQWDNWSISDVLKKGEDDDNWGSLTSSEGYHIWRYVTENTIPTTPDKQRTGLSTGIVFKGKLLAGPQLKEDTNLYKAINGAYEYDSEKSYVYDVAGKLYPVLYVFQGQIYVGWNDEVAGAAKQYGPGHPLYIAAQLDNTEDGPHALYQKLVAAKGTDDESKALADFRKAATAAGFTLYQASNDDALTGPGYYFYYYYWNRHNDNGKPGTMGPMEFGVVRNNVYKLAVTKINRLGHPRITDNDPDPETPDNPDEKSDVYMNVSVEVLPWTVRVNNIEF